MSVCVCVCLCMRACVRVCTACMLDRPITLLYVIKLLQDLPLV